MSDWSQEKETTVIKWLNENSILQDLSAVQGRVPVAIQGTAVGAGDKPPALNIKEDTEEEFFQCAADGDTPNAPDLMMIQEMLNMVRDVNINLEDEYNSDNPVVISKLDANSPEFFPKARDTSTPTEPINTTCNGEKKKKKKRQRNLAIQVLLQSIADNNNNPVMEQVASNTRENNPPLLKPEHFLSTEMQREQIPQTNIVSKIDTVPNAIEKVNGWIETQTTSLFPKKTSKVMLDSSCFMFKKKSVVKEKAKNLEKSNTSLASNGKEYKPSGMVNEYYQKYVEQNKFKETVKDNILWSRIEAKLKEVNEKNEKRHQEAEGSMQSFEDTQISDTDSHTAKILLEMKVTRCVDVVSLPQHRHKLTGPCVVCQAVNDKYTNNTGQPHENVDKTSKIDKENNQDSKGLTNKQTTDAMESTNILLKQRKIVRKIVQESEYALSKCPFVIEDDDDYTAIVRHENIPESFRRIAQERLENLTNETEKLTDETEINNVDIEINKNNDCE